MLAYILSQLEFLLRLVVAGVCGCLIGYERKNRLKEAGVRTHMIVALGAALIMIVSKYGFIDVLQTNGNVLDPSRIAAQIVSGIGFLGAGMIFVRKQAISGLTTAAGVWATAGIGMAIGAQLYFIGIAATILVLFIQVILHKNYRWFHLPVTEQLNIVFNENNDAITYIQEKFAAAKIEIINLKAEKLGNGFLEMELYVKLPQNYDVAGLMNLFKDNPHVKSIEY
jgi:putative Mg2+ transporter-C (MgtC) family protein